MLIAALATAVPSRGDIIARQDFESNSLAAVFGPLPTGQTLAAINATLPEHTGVKFDGTGLGWTVNRTAGNDAAPLETTADTDLIGIADNSSLGSNDLSDAGNGGQWFHFDDVDDALTLEFAAVDTSGFVDLMLSFDVAVNNANFELGDFIEVVVNGVSVFNVVGDDLETHSGSSWVDDFATQSISLASAGFTGGESLVVGVVVENNSATEDIGFDNLLIEGTAVGPAPIPEPSTFAAFGIGLIGVGALRSRRRRAGSK